MIFGKNKEEKLIGKKGFIILYGNDKSTIIGDIMWSFEEAFRKREGLISPENGLIVELEITRIPKAHMCQCQSCHH